MKVVDDQARPGAARLASTARGRLRVACAALALGLGVPMAAAANCRIEVVEMPVAMVDNRAIATVGINGTPVPLIVDTGAFFSFLTDAAADQLKLRTHRAPERLRVEGIVGEVEARTTRVEHLQVLKGDFPNVEFVVGGNEMGHGAMGLLGRNLLSTTDVEYDLAHGIIRFVSPSDECAHSNMAYWAGSTPVSEVELRYRSREVLPGIKAIGQLNGKDVTILFDSGATSFVTLDAARRVGVTKEQMKRAGRMWGAGSGYTPAWTAPFQEFALGGESVRNNRLEIGDVHLDDVDMFLGIDFFLSHRIYVSQKQDRMFFTYNGGVIFPLNRAAPEDAAASASSADASAMAQTPASGASTAPGEPQDADAYARRGAASASRRDFARALADLDRACALAPQVAAYRTRRARVHLALQQRAQAAADLDEALRLDPAQDEARLERATLRDVAGDRQGVLDDLDALDKSLAPQSHWRLEVARLYTRLGLLDKALAQWNDWVPAHPHDIDLPAVLNQRCWARAMLDVELDKALDDCDDAIDEQSKNASFIDSRGWVWLRRGQFAKAIDDFDRALKLEPQLAWSMYGRGVARIGQGDKDAGLADLAAARKAFPAIDAQAARYGLAAAPGTTP